LWPTCIYKDIVKEIDRKINLVKMLESARNNVDSRATVVCLNELESEHLYYGEEPSALFDLLRQCPTVVDPHEDDLIVVMKDGVRPISRKDLFKPLSDSMVQPFTMKFHFLKRVLTEGYKSKKDVLRLVKAAVKYRNSDYYTRTKDFRAARGYCYSGNSVDPYLAGPVYVTNNNVYVEDELPDDYSVDHDFTPLKYTSNIFILNGECESESGASSLSSDTGSDSEVDL
jgi:hypothetical protein